MTESHVQESSAVLGRPKSAAKREAILKAARDLFLEQGFSETSMDAVAARSGVSKATVYSHFQTKEKLFADLIQARAQELVARLPDLSQPSGDPRQDLERFAQAFQRMVLNDEARGWRRLVFSESHRNPECGRALFQAGPSVVIKLLAQYIESEQKAGRLAVDRPDEAAEQLIGLICGLDLIREQTASRTERTEEERRERVSQAVSVFLAAYGTGQSLQNGPRS